MLSSPDFLVEQPQSGGDFQELRTPEGDLHLRFLVGADWEFALPATGIREVVSASPDRITPVPNTSPLLLGIINLRGQVIWVADTSQFLGGTPLSTDRNEISVIAIEDEDAIIGLAVDQVLGMEWLQPDQVRFASNAPDGMAPFLKGEWVLDPQGNDTQSNLCLRLLDPVSVLRSARWAT